MKKAFIIGLWLGMVLMMTSCQKEATTLHRRMLCTATMEQPGGEKTKVHLVNERYIYWEIGDEINIASNTTSIPDNTDEEVGHGYLVDAGGEDFSDYNGAFIASLNDGSQYFLGLFPYDKQNIVTRAGGANFDPITIHLKATQPYRSGAQGDFTFSKNVLPMVAWYGGHWDDQDGSTPFNLDFHNLAGIVRLQFFNATGNSLTIQNIVVSSTNQQLCGPFSVVDYKTYDPHLTPTNNISTNRSLTLSMPSDALGFPNDALRSFYLVLPATKGMTDSTIYHLSVTVNFNSGAYTFTKNLDVPVRRNGITYIRAVGVKTVEPVETQVGLVGNGTEDRPFKIYSIKELQYLRDCYNSVERKINGQPITANTHIQLMRSDISLTHTNWTAGIRNFVGHFSSMANSGTPGIIDSCYNVPLFESIGAGGVVEGIALKCASTFNSNSVVGISPFCTQNAGTIRNCVITTIPGISKYTLSVYSPLAGICVSNTGTIEGCRCEARVEVQTGQNFAGICLHNESTGKIIGCHTSTMTVRVTGKAAGICYENAGEVKDCYFATDIMSSTADWAGIVYENSGTVEHCYLSATGHIYTSKSVGGIVRTNLDGKVDYCWQAGPLQGKTAGGIVDSLVAGQVINCFNSGNAMITVTSATSVGGGLVGYMKGGSIENSYVDDILLNKQNNAATVGGIVGNATGGTITHCYSFEDYNHFYGTSSGVTYTSCYLVNGSQTGPATVSSSTADAFETMQDNLNTGRPTGGKVWTGARTNTTLPHLEGYVVTAKHFFRH